MKVLVIGSGGREHALVKKIKESPKVDSVACCPGNGGISYDAECYDVNAMDIDGVVDLAKEIKADFVVVAPDDPLAAGMVDALNSAGFKTFGPCKRAAIIESSKAFSKELMKKYNIPTAKYEIFSSSADAIEYIKKENTYPAVIKADGLALGKGVIIAKDFASAEKAVHDIMDNKVFGASGNKVVVEEFLTGVEVSVLSFTDGKTIVPMVSSMDHKRALDNDEGLNTGGMGTVSPNPYYTDEVAERCMNEIFKPTVDAMNKEGRTFKGCLYFGLIITKEGPKVIEYNCRFGDPETQVVLPRLKTDIMEIFEAINAGNLGSIDVKWSSEASACVVLASGGYPVKYEKGYEITGLTDGQIEGATIYHAGTVIKDGKLITNGGRVLGITSLAPTLKEAIDNCYSVADKIKFKDKHMRHDIGEKALAQQK